MPSKEVDPEEEQICHVVDQIMGDVGNNWTSIATEFNRQWKSGTRLVPQFMKQQWEGPMLAEMHQRVDYIRSQGWISKGHKQDEWDSFFSKDGRYDAYLLKIPKEKNPFLIGNKSRVQNMLSFHASGVDVSVGEKEVPGGVEVNVFSAEDRRRIARRLPRRKSMTPCGPIVAVTPNDVRDVNGMMIAPQLGRFQCPASVHLPHSCTQHSEIEVYLSTNDAKSWRRLECYPKRKKVLVKITELGIICVLHPKTVPERVRFHMFKSSMDEFTPGKRISVGVWLTSDREDSAAEIEKFEELRRAKRYWPGYEEFSSEGPFHVHLGEQCAFNSAPYEFGKVSRITAEQESAMLEYKQQVVVTYRTSKRVEVKQLVPATIAYVNKEQGTYDVEIEEDEKHGVPEGGRTDLTREDIWLPEECTFEAMCKPAFGNVDVVRWQGFPVSLEIAIEVPRWTSKHIRNVPTATHTYLMFDHSNLFAFEHGDRSYMCQTNYRLPGGCTGCALCGNAPTPEKKKQIRLNKKAKSGDEKDEADDAPKEGESEEPQEDTDDPDSRKNPPGAETAGRKSSTAQGRTEASTAVSQTAASKKLQETLSLPALNSPQQAASSPSAWKPPVYRCPAGVSNQELLRSHNPSVPVLRRYNIPSTSLHALQRHMFARHR